MERFFINDLSAELASLVAENGSEFGQLSSETMVEVYQPKETILNFSRPVDRLRFLIKGRAKITLVHENGRQSIVHFVLPEEYLGELSFLEVEKEPKNVIAITACVFISVSLVQAKAVLGSDAQFLFKLAQSVGRKVLKRTYFSSKNQNFELKYRLAAYILLLANNGVYSEKHTETAEYLGVSYRHLLYTMKGFVDDGLMIRGQKGYSINQEGLEELAVNIETISSEW